MAGCEGASAGGRGSDQSSGTGQQEAETQGHARKATRGHGGGTEGRSRSSLHLH